MNKEQLIKKYFPELKIKDRKTWLKGFESLTPEQLETHLKELKNKVELERTKDRAILLESIIYNSLGYERNEALSNSCYQNYKNKLISKFAKHFINGQYRVFRNENEKLIVGDPTNTNKIVSDIEEVITLLANNTIEKNASYKEVLKALAKDEKSLMGIVNKINKN